jgi:hypothetical protein
MELLSTVYLLICTLTMHTGIERNYTPTKCCKTHPPSLTPLPPPLAVLQVLVYCRIHTPRPPQQLSPNPRGIVCTQFSIAAASPTESRTQYSVSTLPQLRIAPGKSKQNRPISLLYTPASSLSFISASAALLGASPNISASKEGLRPWVWPRSSSD